MAGGAWGLAGGAAAGPHCLSAQGEQGLGNAGRQLQFTEKYALRSSAMQLLQGDTFICVVQLTLFTTTV